MVDQKKSVNFFKFFDDLNTFALIFFMFYLFPLKMKKFLGFEKKVKLINLFLTLTYFSYLVFIIGCFWGF